MYQAAYNMELVILATYRCDHNPISLTFSNHLSQNQDSTKMVKEVISLAKNTNALQVYSLDFITLDNGENLELNISSTLFLDTLLCQLRGAVIDFSKKFKKSQQVGETTKV